MKINLMEMFQRQKTFRPLRSVATAKLASFSNRHEKDCKTEWDSLYADWMDGWMEWLCRQKAEREIDDNQQVRSHKSAYEEHKEQLCRSKMPDFNLKFSCLSRKLSNDEFNEIKCLWACGMFRPPTLEKPFYTWTCSTTHDINASATDFASIDLNMQTREP